MQLFHHRLYEKRARLKKIKLKSEIKILDYYKFLNESKEEFFILPLHIPRRRHLVTGLIYRRVPLKRDYIAVETGPPKKPGKRMNYVFRPRAAV